MKRIKKVLIILLLAISVFSINIEYTKALDVEILSVDRVNNKKSSNNYLKSLEIEGYSIDFKSKKTKYEIEVDNVKNIKIHTVTKNDNASVFVTYPEKYVVGKNIIKIRVVAENNKERTYEVIVNYTPKQPEKEPEKEKEPEEIKKEEKESETNVNDHIEEVNPVISNGILAFLFMLLVVTFYIDKKLRDADDVIKQRKIEKKKREKQKVKQEKTKAKEKAKKNREKIKLEKKKQKEQPKKEEPKKEELKKEVKKTKPVKKEVKKVKKEVKETKEKKIEKLFETGALKLNVDEKRENIKKTPAKKQTKKSIEKAVETDTKIDEKKFEKIFESKLSSIDIDEKRKEIKEKQAKITKKETPKKKLKTIETKTQKELLAEETEVSTEVDIKKFEKLFETGALQLDIDERRKEIKEKQAKTTKKETPKKKLKTLETKTQKELLAEEIEVSTEVDEDKFHKMFDAEYQSTLKGKKRKEISKKQDKNDQSLYEVKEIDLSMFENFIDDNSLNVKDLFAEDEKKVKYRKKYQNKRNITEEE